MATLRVPIRAAITGWVSEASRSTTYVPMWTFRQARGSKGGGERGLDDDWAARGERVSARRSWVGTYSDPSADRGPTINGIGWWGENPPFRHPVFVLTHHPRNPIPMKGGTMFDFVTDGIEAALEGRRGGGRTFVSRGRGDRGREYLRAGLVDEMHVAIAPILLGGGERLF